MARLSGIVVEGSDVALQFTDGTRHEFAAVWLRDACRCPDCRDPATDIRREGLPPLDPDLAVARAWVGEDGGLECRWFDGHATSLGAEWLLAAIRPAAGVTAQRLWRGDFRPFAAAHDDLDDPGLLAWLTALWRDGVALVHDMPATREELRRFAGRIGPIRASNYGPDWEIEASPDPFSPVDSEQGLRVHVDLPYRQLPPGIQLNLAARTKATGGAATLTDGFAVLDALRQDDEEAYTALTRAAYSTHWRSPHHDLTWSGPLVELDAHGAPRLIRHAPGLAGEVSGDPATTRAAYRAANAFTELAEDPRFRITVPLRDGDLVAMQNHRVLHGRTAFDLSTGGRTLLGCYLDVDDLHSTIRVLQRAGGPTSAPVRRRPRAPVSPPAGGRP